MNREDELWAVRVGFNLLTEPCNVHVDGSGKRHRFISPHSCQKFVTRDGSALMLDEVSKQLEFACGQVDCLAVAEYLLRCQIHSNVAELNDLRSRHAALDFLVRGSFQTICSGDAGLKFGKILPISRARMCFVRTSEKTSRKSVVTARSRPSKSCSVARPGHIP
jgi:hypothetical protein